MKLIVGDVAGQIEHPALANPVADFAESLIRRAEGQRIEDGFGRRRDGKSVLIQRAEVVNVCGECDVHAFQ